MLFEAIASLVFQLSDDPVYAELSKQLASPAGVEVATKATFDRSGCRQREPLDVHRVHRFPCTRPSTEPRVVPAVVWTLLAGTLAISCKQRWQQRFFPAILHAMDDETSGCRATSEAFQTVLEHQLRSRKTPIHRSIWEIWQRFLVRERSNLGPISPCD